MSDESESLLVRRLVAIKWTDWESAFDHAGSRTRLMREYLRRAALWAQALRGTEVWPFFDIAQQVDPSVCADGELADFLEDFLSEHVPGSMAAKVCRAALNWEALPREVLNRFSGLPDPFAPLIMVFERGGDFSIENGFIDFVANRVRVKTWQEHVSTQEIVALDSAVLDAVDVELQ